VAVIFEIINPSDQYTLKHDDFAVCCAACLLLGHGKYALTQLDAAADAAPLELPLFLFDGDAAVPWFREKFGAGLGEFIKANLLRIADCLDTVVIGGPETRAAYERGLELIDDPAKRQIWRDEWLDERRSSMNNIGRSATLNANHLRQAAAKFAGGAS
jgi:hypothetical protein